MSTLTPSFHQPTYPCQTSNRLLLAVFAHPDDETFGSGGTLALNARQGIDVYLICAMRGEALTDLKGFAFIGEMREAELRQSVSILGPKAVYFLGYRDSGMPGSAGNHHPEALAAAPVEPVAHQVAGYIRELRPQVVITFDPIGVYRHPDHIAIHHATVEALRLAGDSGQVINYLPPYAPQKPYYLTLARRLLRLVVCLLGLVGRDPRRFGQNQDIDLASLAESEFRIDASVSISNVMHTKEQAAACRASQGGGIDLPRWLQHWFGRHETFIRAIPKTPPVRLEWDLFEGVQP